MSRGRRSPVVARKLRPIQRTPATENNATEVEFQTEYEGPLLTETAAPAATRDVGVVIELETADA